MGAVDGYRLVVVAVLGVSSGYLMAYQAKKLAKEPSTGVAAASNRWDVPHGRRRKDGIPTIANRLRCQHSGWRRFVVFLPQRISRRFPLHGHEMGTRRQNQRKWTDRKSPK
jgi:hypothetical protein